MHRPKHHYRQITREKAHEIRRRYFAREANQPQLAKEFGVHVRTVEAALCRRNWGRV
jgi:DNA-binding transcriptional regulator LsrR (DeoR family)